MSMMRATFQRLYYQGLKQLINIGYNKELPMEWTQYFHSLDSSSAFEEDMSMAGGGLFVQTPEGMEFARDQWYPGWRKRYNHVDFTSGIGFSHQQIRDLKVPMFNDRTKDLGFSGRQTQEILFADLINGAFDATLCPDGEFWASASHPSIRPGGAAQSNILGTPGPPNWNTIRDICVMGRRYFDDTGKRRIVTPFKYVNVPPELEAQAQEIMLSPDRPDTANRAKNVLSGKFTVRVYTYLTSTTRWSVSTEKEGHYAKVYTREKFHTWEVEDEIARTNWVAAAFAVSYGISHWRGYIFVNSQA